MAESRPTTQSSTCCHGASSRAVDGNKNTQWRGNSCTHTHKQNNPWWRVDLEKELAVETLSVTNRGCVALNHAHLMVTAGCDCRDCCGSRLSNFEVKVGNTDNWNANTKVPPAQMFVMC